MQRAIDAFNAHLPELIEESVRRVIAAKIPLYQRMSPEQVNAGITRAFSAVQEDVVNGTTSAFPLLLVALGKQRIGQDVALNDMLEGANLGFAVVSDFFDRYFGDDLEPKLWWERARVRVSYGGAVRLWEAVLATRDEVIRRQTEEIQRLAMPIVPLHDGILLLPLVGTIDARRAEHMTSVMLHEIVRQQAATVIIDVTGVADVDDAVIGYIVRAAQATQLLGAEPVLVGVNPAVAQSIAALALDLNDMTVRADLGDGIEYALRRQGKAIKSRRAR